MRKLISDHFEDVTVFCSHDRKEFDLLTNVDVAGQPFELSESLNPIYLDSHH